MRPTILISGVVLLALIGQVELFKLFKHSPAAQAPSQAPPIQQQTEQQEERLYPQSPLYLQPPATQPLLDGQFYAQAPIQQQQVRQPELGAAVKGGPEHEQRLFEGPVRSGPSPVLASPPAFTYLIVRPVQQQQAQYQYLDPYRFGGPGVGLLGGQQAYRPSYSYFRQNEQSSEQPATKGAQRQNEETQQQAIVEQQQQQQQQQAIEQQHEIQHEEQKQVPAPQAPRQQPPAQAAIVIPIAPGKEGKLKALLDKIRSKLTLGSSYEVVSEEFVHSSPVKQPQPAPIEQQQQQQQVVGEQQVEQEQQREIGAHEEKLVQQEQQQVVQEPQLEQQQQQQLEQQPDRQQEVKGQRFEETKGNALKVEEAKGFRQEEIKGFRQEEIKGPRQEEFKGNLRPVEESRSAKRYQERPSVQLATELGRQSDSNGPIKAGY